jgi:uncharacterized protein
MTLVRHAGSSLRAISLVWLLLAAAAFAAPLPPTPTRFFNDYAGMVSSGTADRLNRALEDFERQTSSQILVAIFPKLPADAALEDFTLRTAAAWKPGLKEKDNGAVLFIFRDDRKMRIEVGYGLEGPIPDLIAKRIIDNEIRPRFRSGDFDGGVTAGVNALLQAARGEYRGTGTTVKDRSFRKKDAFKVIFGLLLLVAFIAGSIRRRGTIYGRRRGSYWGSWGALGGGWGGGWSSGGGGGSSGGGGGFSSGGGGFGGGGASGGW